MSYTPYAATTATAKDSIRFQQRLLTCDFTDWQALAESSSLSVGGRAREHLDGVLEDRLLWRQQGQQ